jgi:hypothetical protein
METNFKVGDKVYCCIHGHGVVTSVDYTESYPLFVNFGYDTNNYTFDGKLYDDCKPTLSFTEYTLQGFSQERPIKLPEVGELCLVRDEDNEGWRAVIFRKYLPSEEYPYKSDKYGYKQLKRIKILD